MNHEAQSLEAERRLWASEAVILEAKSINAQRQAILCARRIAEIEGREIEPHPLMRDERRNGVWQMAKRAPLATPF